MPHPKTHFSQYFFTYKKKASNDTLMPSTDSSVGFHYPLMTSPKEKKKEFWNYRSTYITLAPTSRRGVCQRDTQRRNQFHTIPTYHNLSSHVHCHGINLKSFLIMHPCQNHFLVPSIFFPCVNGKKCPGRLSVFRIEEKWKLKQEHVFAISLNRHGIIKILWPVTF